MANIEKNVQCAACNRWFTVSVYTPSFFEIRIAGNCSPTIIKFCPHCGKLNNYHVREK